MFSDLDILYALASDSKGYASQCYQKLVERSLDNVEDNSSNDSDRTIVDGARSKVRKQME